MPRIAVLGIVFMIVGVIPALTIGDNAVATDRLAGGLGTTILIGLFACLGRIYKRNKELGFAIAATIATVLVLYASYHSKRVVQAASIDKIKEHPAMGEMFQSLDRHFPDRYAELVSAVKADVASGVSEEQLWTNIRTIHGPRVIGPLRKAVPNASDGKLANVLVTRVAAMKVLQVANPDACGRMIMGDVDRATMAIPGYLQRTNAGMVAIIEAAADAAKSPVRRSDPTEKQYALLAQGVADQGMDPRRMAAIGETSSADMSNKERCDLAIGMYQAAMHMPVEERGPIMAQMLTE